MLGHKQGSARCARRWSAGQVPGPQVVRTSVPVWPLATAALADQGTD